MTWPRFVYGTVEDLIIPFSTAPDNVTDYQVDIAVVAYPDRPGDSDWQTATWDTDDDGNPTAVITIGTSQAIDPDPGTYTAYARVTAGSRAPILESGIIQIV